ncbi:fungal-specific transcription factor domain-containing protein [Mycena epipterygia]|nr:fungal-specific transcription factor domain-containing protein [Mycena epipterygia]
MPSDEESYESEFASKEKRKRACDICRRKKRRCDGREKCSRCTKHNFTCTYVGLSTATRPAGPSAPEDLHDTSNSMPGHSRSYVEALETRVKTLETRVKTLEALLEQHKVERGPGVEIIRHAIRDLNCPWPEPHSDDLTFVEIDKSFRSLSVNSDVSQGFQGKSSGAMLVKVAVDIRNSVKNASAADSTAHEVPRPMISKHWEAPESSPPPAYSFPEDDLLASLLSLYFTSVNPFLPLFQRPLFEACVNQRLHQTHSGFAKTLLLVCALGARYSSDPRVSTNDIPLAAPAGSRWFDQVELSGHLDRSPTLYDLQSYCVGSRFVCRIIPHFVLPQLAAEFLECTSRPRTSWTIVGFGIRLAQDIGAHRFKVPSSDIPFEEELEKRASWILFLLEAQISTALGRCIVLHPHDFDIGMPTRCDDEYWVGLANSAAPMFSQPANKPSVLEFFIRILELNRIMAFSCKMLYATNRSKTLMGLNDDRWEEQIVVEIDSALNTWFETIPDHLRWDPDNLIQDDIFFDQSATLYCMYYHTQILIHRPFIPAMKPASNPKLPSLAICNTAARACSHVAQIQQQRRPNNPLWFSQTSLFTSAIVLLLNIWGGSASGVGRIYAAEKDLADVHRCIAVLRAQRQQWPSTGPLLDTLQELVAVDRPIVEVNTAPQPTSLASAYTGATSELQLGDTLGLTMYDPRLETAPQHYVDDNSWYDPVFADPMFSTAEQTYTTSSGYTSGDMGFPAGVDAQDFDVHAGASFGAEDFDMGTMNTHTIALWSRAPSGFGVADWDMYLGKFVEDMQSPQENL